MSHAPPVERELTLDEAVDDEISSLVEELTPAQRRFDRSKWQRAMQRSSRPMLTALRAFERWVKSGLCQIRNKANNRLVPLSFNALQWKLHEQLKRMAARRKPIRFIGLKGRKMGFSTYVQALSVFLCSFLENWEAVTLAHVGPETTKLFGIARLVRMCDESVHVEERNKGVRGTKIAFDNMSHYHCRTGGGESVLSGSTTNFAHLSELAKWTGQVRDQLDSIQNSVPDVEMSVIIIESTAYEGDQSGEFERMWTWAMGGRGAFEPIFIAWYEDSDYRIKGGTIDSPDADERVLIEKHGVDQEQLAWRRWKIATTFTGDTLRFKREFPSSPEEAFQVARGRIFPCLTASKHVWRADMDTLVSSGFEFYRGIDFGGSDAFVCVGVAHRPGNPGFTVDTQLCADAWRELCGYKRDANGKPVDKDNHCVDCLRYVVTHFNLTGHIHVYKLLYEVDSAHRGKSLLDLAVEIKTLWAAEEKDVMGTVADRSRPDSIVLLNQQSIPVSPYRQPETIRWGEIEDGIATMHALMLATVPLIHPPPPKPRAATMLDRRQDAAFSFGFSSAELMLEMNEYRQASSMRDIDMSGGGFFV